MKLYLQVRYATLRYLEKCLGKVCVLWHRVHCLQFCSKKL